MKLIVVLLLFVACKGRVSSSSFEGMFTRELKDAFTKGRDTLVIAFVTAKYEIERRLYYQQTIDGKSLTPQYKIEHWKAVQDPATGDLIEQKQGRVFMLARAGDKLLMGSIIYQRVK